MNRRFVASVVLTAAAVAGGWQGRVYTPSPEAGVLGGQVVRADTSILWGADEDGAMLRWRRGGAQSESRPQPAARLRVCWSPWLVPYMKGNTQPIKKMLACAVKLWPVRGGLDKALEVVDCESSFNPYTEHKGHLGLFQHAEKYWLERWWRWGLDMGVPRNPMNAWSNIIVSVRIINRYGWSAWSCA